MSDNPFSKRDFINLISNLIKPSLLAPILTNNENSRITPEFQDEEYSEILGRLPDFSVRAGNGPNIHDKDVLSAEINGKFRLDYGILSSRLYYLVETKTRQALDHVDIHWIGEFDRPTTHSEAKPNFESALIYTHSTPDIFGQVEDKCFFVTSSGPGERKMVDLTTIAEHGELTLHKGGVLMKKIDLGNENYITEVFKFSDGNFQRVISISELKNKQHNNSYTQNVSNEKSLGYIEKLIVTTDDHIGLLRTESNKNPILTILSNDQDQVLELKDYDADTIHSNTSSELFVLGKYVGYFSLQNKDGETPPQVVFRLLDKNTDYGEVMNIPLETINKVQNAGFLIKPILDRQPQSFSDQSRLGRIVLFEPYGVNEFGDILTIEIKTDGTIQLNQDMRVVELMTKAIGEPQLPRWQRTTQSL
ncbi:MAG: hypothetical protein WA152_03785 [Microgenomates group bacterium]